MAVVTTQATVIVEYEVAVNGLELLRNVETRPERFRLGTVVRLRMTDGTVIQGEPIGILEYHRRLASLMGRSEIGRLEEDGRRRGLPQDPQHLHLGNVTVRKSDGSSQQCGLGRARLCLVTDYAIELHALEL